ncbi:hypothetical protein Tco_0393288 [Tanacetum coccineum]
MNSLLSPILDMTIAECKRQRVLVTSCVFYYEFNISHAQSALALITPGWAAAFASPPAAMSFAMIAAGAAGSEAAPPTPAINIHLKHKATARAAALAVVRYLERNNKIGSGRGLSDVAMATSSQRRSKHDMERVMRWNISEAMGIAWMESFARNMQRSEVDRSARVDFIAQHRRCTGIHAWRKLIHYLIETDTLFGLLSKRFCNPKRVLNSVFGFWKIDYMETSTRMHRCLRRDFKGSDHSGISVVSEDPLKLERDKQNSLEALSTALVNEDDDQDAAVNVEFNIDEMWLYEYIQTRPSAIVVCFRDRGNIISNKPDNHYELLNKKKKVTNNEGESQNSPTYPPGFTPNDNAEDNINTSNVEPVERGHNGDKEEGEFVVSQNPGPRTGGSIIQLIEDLVNVGQTMGYDMTGCM